MNRVHIILLPVLAAVACLAAGCGSSTGSATTPSDGAALVSTARNASLGSSVLVNQSGLTLYTLSAESRSHFICTKGATVPGSSGTHCLSLWKPLLAPPGAKLGGAVGSLDVVMRPDGVGNQVTYRGLPLYTFVQDTQPGDALGNGFKDVGTWSPATVGGGATQPPASSRTGPYGY
jgi:predicted lipoprotein with Yx(FWY)xxD motif